jgi:hypothetical protein
MESNQILKIAIQKALAKNLPLILEDAVQYLENHQLQLKRRKKIQKTSRRTESIKDHDVATIPYFDELSEPEEQYDCPPATWEDIGVWDEATPKSDMADVFRLEDVASSNPIVDQGFNDSLYEQLD